MVPHVEESEVVRPAAKRKKRGPVKVTQSWYLVVFNALCIPALIIFLQIFFDVVPFYPEIGAFIMAIGAISVIACFSVIAKYKEVNERIGMSWAETRKLKKKDLRELVSRMYFVAGLAEIPSIAGLLYFLATRDLIASFILCIPAIVMAILCKPLLPDNVLAKLR